MSAGAVLRYALFVSSYVFSSILFTPTVYLSIYYYLLVNSTRRLLFLFLFSITISSSL